jgi:hypothetical protein
MIHGVHRSHFLICLEIKISSWLTHKLEMQNEILEVTSSLNPLVSYI